MLNKINISSKKQFLIIAIAMSVVTLAVFCQVNKFDFVFDDLVYVTENSHIQSGITWDGFRWAFCTKHTGLWNPMVWLSLMIDYQLYSLNAGAYHMTNLMLHILSALLLFWLFNRMSKEIWKSAFIAALFALHPLHVESVAWVAERKDVLSAFFWMLTLCLYVYYTEKPIIRRYLLVIFSFILALMSKPMVVTVPVIMILLDYWPLERFESHKGKTNSFLWQLKEKIPFFVLSLILVIVMLYNPNENPKEPVAYLKGLPLILRLANAPVAFIAYLEKTFWPHNMAVLYPFPEQIPLWHSLGSTLLIIIISATVCFMAKRLPYLFVGWLWYAITIAPVIGIIQISFTTPYAMADRYHYLPSIGLSIMMAWGIPSLIKSEEIRNKFLFPFVIAVFVTLAFLTWMQCGYWKNNTMLWNHTLQVTKNNYIAHNNLGFSLFAEGKIEKAIDHYNKAILLKSNYADAYFNRGTGYAARGQYQLAIDDFNKTIMLKPNYHAVYNSRGVVYAKRGQYQLAIDDFKKSISLKHDNADAYNNRAFACFNQDSKELCCDDAKKACALGNCRTLNVAKGKGYCR